MVGHDIGLMVAYAYAAQFPQETRKLVLMDAFLPGIGNWKDMWLLRDLWHMRGQVFAILVSPPLAGKDQPALVTVGSENILTVRPSLIKDILTIGTNPEKEYSVFVSNQTQIPLVIDEVRESTAFHQFAPAYPR